MMNRGKDKRQGAILVMIHLCFRTLHNPVIT
jgi:hypothetical protein